jgi:predicted acyltransferase (DUF342 family)
MIKTDMEYLERPLIEGQEFIITDELIKVTTPSTIHAHIRKIMLIERSEVNKLYTAVVKAAKERGVKIGYSYRIKRDIIGKYNEYLTAIGQAQSIFKQAVQQAKVVKERGLHNGTSDDMELRKLHEICWAFEKFGHRDSIVRKTADAYRRLEELHREMTIEGKQNIKIYL